MKTTNFVGLCLGVKVRESGVNIASFKTETGANVSVFVSPKLATRVTTDDDGTETTHSILGVGKAFAVDAVINKAGDPVLDQDNNPVLDAAGQPRVFQSDAYGCLSLSSFEKADYFELLRICQQ